MATQHYDTPPGYDESWKVNSQGAASYPAANGQMVVEMHAAGQADQEVGEPAAGWVGSSFSDKKIRHAFIRKVYLILLIQLTITAGFICLFLFCEPVKSWVKQNSWFYWASYGVFLVTYVMLACFTNIRRRVPFNYIFLLIFTLAMSYMTGTISSYYSTEIVLIAISVTALLCLSITLFAIQTRIDFTLCAGLLYCLCMVLFFCGCTCLLFYIIGYYSYLNVLYGGLAAVVLSLLLVYDTQIVVGRVGAGKHRKEQVQLSPEEYITGALSIYLDIIYIFWILLALIGCCSN